MQIKIRAWDTQLENFIYSGYGSKTFSIFAKKTNFSRFIKDLFTGLKDKNGKEIYEGDIYKYIGLDSRLQYNIEVIFEKGCFLGAIIVNGIQQNLHVIGKSDLNRIEVVGNIYQNPELLEANNALCL